MELLVVIAIISILISLLMPSLSQVRSRAFAVQCTSNLRQVVQAGLLDTETRAVPHANHPGLNRPGLLPDSKWWQGAANSRGSIALYLGISPDRHYEDSVLTCPRDQTVDPPQNRLFNRTYSMNVYAGGTREARDVYPPNTFSQVRHPERMAFFFDGVSTVGRGNYWTAAAPWRHLTGNECTFHYSHDDGIQVGYVDGHVGHVPRREILQIHVANWRDLAFWVGDGE